LENKSNILLIYTGGTIGMIKDYDTGALRAFDFDKIEERIPELKQLDCNVEAISFLSPIDSSDMSPKYWIEIAELIEENYEKYNGFVVLHGSDTMSYSASALSFMLENLSKPVIFTGSQLPIGDLRTDAKENLITSIQIASLDNEYPKITEVCLYFEYKLYRANRTTKINAEHFNAFASLNYPELGESGVHLTIHLENLFRPKIEGVLKVHKELDNRIVIIKLFPGLNEQAISSVFKNENIKAIVLETYGSGNAFTTSWFYQLLEEAIQRGVYIVNVTQCNGGSVIMGQYETSVHLKKIGIIDGKNITTEAALAKLMYLLGSETSKKDFKKLFETSLRGELD